jgi:hypothetical protein
MSREKVITIRVTHEERDSYRALAASNGKALGEYIRFLLEREKILLASAAKSKNV